MTAVNATTSTSTTLQLQKPPLAQGLYSLDTALQVPQPRSPVDSVQ